MFVAMEGEPKTIVELMTSEWDQAVKQFVRTIARQSETVLELAANRVFTGKHED